MLQKVLLQQGRDNQKRDANFVLTVNILTIETVSFICVQFPTIFLSAMSCKDYKNLHFLHIKIMSKEQ